MIVKTNIIPYSELGKHDKVYVEFLNDRAGQEPTICFVSELCKDNYVLTIAGGEGDGNLLINTLTLEEDLGNMKFYEYYEKTRGFEAVEKAYRVHPNVDIVLPTRATAKSAGYDFVTPVDIVVPPHGYSVAIQTDVKAYMQDDEVLELHIRSSLGFKKGLRLINCTGIIDADYYSNADNDGNIGIKLYNASEEEVIVKAGERIMQGIFTKYLIVDEDNANGERTGGYGSTGKF